MKDPFWTYLWSSFRATQNIVIGGFGLVLAFLAWIFSPDYSIPLSVVVIVSLIALVFVVTLFDAASKIYTSKSQLPEIVRVYSDRIDPLPMCLLDRSQLFSFGTSVSFYYVEDEKFERLIGTGTVENIQDDGYIQVRLTHTMEGNEDIFASLLNNDKNILQRVRVKPHIPTQFAGL